MVSDPEQENVKPRYLYSLVLWIICFLKKKLYFLIREPCLLKTIIFVFFRFTSSFHLVQYSSKLVIYFCNERGQVDIRTRSSAYFRHDISMLPIATGLFPLNLNMSGKSFIYKLKSVVLRASPCFIPLIIPLSPLSPYCMFK